MKIARGKKIVFQIPQLLNELWIIQVRRDSKKTTTGADDREDSVGEWEKILMDFVSLFLLQLSSFHLLGRRSATL